MTFCFFFLFNKFQQYIQSLQSSSFHNSIQMHVWEGHNMYKQCQLIIEFTLSNHSHYSLPSLALLFALLYLSTLFIP